MQPLNRTVTLLTTFGGLNHCQQTTLAFQLLTVDCHCLEDNHRNIEVANCGLLRCGRDCLISR
jgi:hypothetical protein